MYYMKMCNLLSVTYLIRRVLVALNAINKIKVYKIITNYS